MKKIHEKATLSRLASHAFCDATCKPADLSQISPASKPPAF